jgi:hypothetical protein
MFGFGAAFKASEAKTEIMSQRIRRERNPSRAVNRDLPLTFGKRVLEILELSPNNRMADRTIPFLKKPKSLLT